MAERTYPHFDQHYSKYIFRNSMSHNLQRAKENGDNINFYWIKFIISPLFLWKQFYNPKLKVIIIISSMIHLTIAYNALGISFNNVNINSLLSKIEELRNIAKCSNAAVIGITETKLDNAVYDSEVAIDGYRIVRNDRTRKGGVVGCYIRSNICYARKTSLWQLRKHIDLLYPKRKPISVGIFYKPPSQTRFPEQIITEFESLELNNELYILGDFNTNLLFKGNSILNKTHEIKNHFKDFSLKIKKYNEFCSIYVLKNL